MFAFLQRHSSQLHQSAVAAHVSTEGHVAIPAGMSPHVAIQIVVCFLRGLYSRTPMILNVMKGTHLCRLVGHTDLICLIQVRHMRRLAPTLSLMLLSRNIQTCQIRKHLRDSPRTLLPLRSWRNVAMFQVQFLCTSVSYTVCTKRCDAPARVAKYTFCTILLLSKCNVLAGAAKA